MAPRPSKWLPAASRGAEGVRYTAVERCTALEDALTEETTRPAEDEDLLQIGVFAALAGTNLRTLRYYEEIGLLEPAARSAGGFRSYRRADLDRMRMVARLQALGLELARIRALMDTRSPARSRDDLLGGVRTALEEQVALTDERIAALAGNRRELERALAKLGECESCSHHPVPGNNFCHPCQVDGKPPPADLSALF